VSKMKSKLRNCKDSQRFLLQLLPIKVPQTPLLMQFKDHLRANLDLRQEGKNSGFNKEMGQKDLEWVSETLNIQVK
jgi:hypothetical protein